MIRLEYMINITHKTIMVSPRILVDIETTLDQRQDLINSIQKVKEMTSDNLKKIVPDCLDQDAMAYPRNHHLSKTLDFKFL